MSYCRGYASPSSPGFDVMPAASGAVASSPAGKHNGNNGNGNGRSPGKSPANHLDLDQLNEALFG